MGRNAKDKRDIYYRLAKQRNLRSRSAFKLIQIDSFFKLFENLDFEDLIVDLCSSPGGWSQVSSEYMIQKLNSSNVILEELNNENISNYGNNKDNNQISIKDEIEKIENNLNNNIMDKSDKLDKNKYVVSIDVQKMLDLEGVHFIQGDITNQSTIESLLLITIKRKIKLVICDGAPDIICLPDFDNYVQTQLVLCALNFSIKTLVNGGTFVSKIYRGFNFLDIILILKCFYKKVSIAKPKTSRNASFEAFVVCEDYEIDIYNALIKKCEYLIEFLTLNENVFEEYNYNCFKEKLIQFTRTKISTVKIDDEDIIHLNDIPFILRFLKFIESETHDFFEISNNVIKEQFDEKSNKSLINKIKEFLDLKDYDNVENSCYFNDSNLICKNKYLDNEDILLENSLKKMGVNFYQVGEEDFDSDKTYDLESTNYYQSLNPTQMPIDPPYKKYIDDHKGKVIKLEK